MPDTVFKKVDYQLSSLVDYIELGEIGLPDIQVAMARACMTGVARLTSATMRLSRRRARE